MKKILILGLVLVGVVFSSTGYTQNNSQITFPIWVVVGWDKNADVDQVIDYTLVHNNGNTNTSYTVLHANCTNSQAAGECQTTISVPGSQEQTLSVYARNMWGSSQPETVRFSVSFPGKPKNVKITVPASR